MYLRLYYDSQHAPPTFKPNAPPLLNRSPKSMVGFCFKRDTWSEPQRLPIPWAHVPIMAVVSYNSNLPPNDLGNYSDLNVTFNATSSVRDPHMDLSDTCVLCAKIFPAKLLLACLWPFAFNERRSRTCATSPLVSRPKCPNREFHILHKDSATMSVEVLSNSSIGQGIRQEPFWICCSGDGSQS